MKSENINSSNVHPGDEAPNARSLILRLLAVVEGGTLSVSEAVRACALFDISENSVRVTLARLTQAGRTESVDRGVYRLGPLARQLGADVAAWRTVEDRLTDWSGRWIAVATGGLPRSDRKVLRARERALSMLGMRELDNGLYLRPDNLRGGVEAVRARLTGLGLGAEAAVFRASGFDPEREGRALGLWQGTPAESYGAEAARLTRWLEQAETLPLQQAARESYVLGDAAIRRIVFDPMLPAPLADEAARRAYVDTAKRFDDAGRRIWAEFLAEARA
jgi:phenylacetic acid degradation operon negative regulatory protein